MNRGIEDWDVEAAVMGRDGSTRCKITFPGDGEPDVVVGGKYWSNADS